MTKQVYVLYEISAPRPAFNVFRLTSNEPLNRQKEEIYVDGKAWLCSSIELTGAEKTTDDVAGVVLRLVLPRPYQAIQAQKNIVKANTLIRRIITGAEALEFSNFTETVRHPTGIVNYKIFKQDYFVVRRVEDQTYTEIQANLIDFKSGWDDLFQPDFPGRCNHKYRGAGCGYQGSKYWDLNNKTVTEFDQDECNLTVDACRLRFPTGALRFGGVPEQIQNQTSRL